MKVINDTVKDAVITVTLNADKAEFDNARHKAYLENTGHYPVPGVLEGEADLATLQKFYGPAVLYDEAMQSIIPEFFRNYLENEGTRIMGKPVVKDVTYNPDGGISFTIEADSYPEVTLGEYKGIHVPYSRKEDYDTFRLAVLKHACESMQGSVPRHMVDQKLKEMEAREKIRANNDSVYHLLADSVVLLKRAYGLVGLTRPDAEVRADAMDIMLQAVSFDNQEMPRDYLISQMEKQVERYRETPLDFTEKMNQIVEDRIHEKSKMKPEELIEDVFRAYLGSQDLTEESWREARSLEAAQDAAFDLLYEKVAEMEGLSVSDDEMHEAFHRIAEQYKVETDDVVKNVDHDAVRWQILRDKAEKLILDSAVGSDE